MANDSVQNSSVSSTTTKIAYAETKNGATQSATLTVTQSTAAPSVQTNSDKFVAWFALGNGTQNIANGFSVASAKTTLPTVEDQIAVATNVAKNELDGIISKTENQADTSKLRLGQSQKTWNENIVKGLGLKRGEVPIDEKSGFKDLDKKDLAEVQIRSLVKPQDIQDKVWNTLPDTLEAPSHLNGNIVKESTQGAKWSDRRKNITEANGKNVYYNLKETSSDLKKNEDFIQQIDTLKNAGWIYAKTVFIQVPGENGEVSSEARTIKVQLSPEQIKVLQTKRAELQKDLDSINKADGDIQELGKNLRVSKTVKNIFANPSYIREKLINPTLDALKNASWPLDKIIILNGLKEKVTALLGDVYDLQGSSSSTVAKNEELEKANNGIVQKIIKRVFDKVSMSFGSNFGDFMVEQHPPETLPNDSPLGELNDSNCKAEMKKAYGDLNKLFASVEKGEAKLNFTTIAPFAKALQKASPTKEVEYKDKLNDKKPSLLTPGNSDNDYHIVDYTKQAFDEFFGLDDKGNMQNSGKAEAISVQFGFVPFASTSGNQENIEKILNSPRYKDLYRFPPASEGVEWSPAILSRVMYLYNNYKNSEQGFEAQNKKDIGKANEIV